jgi:hypothetical protein
MIGLYLRLLWTPITEGQIVDKRLLYQIVAIVVKLVTKQLSGVGRENFFQSLAFNFPIFPVFTDDSKEKTGNISFYYGFMG